MVRLILFRRVRAACIGVAIAVVTGGLIVFASQTSSAALADGSEQQPQVAADFAPSAQRCSEMRTALAGTTTETNEQLGQLAEATVRAPGRVQFSASFKEATTPSEFRRRAGGQQIKALSATFPNFIGNTNFNSEFEFDSQLSYEANVEAWRTAMVQTLNDQLQFSLREGSPGDSGKTIRALVERLEAKDIPVIGGRFEGANSDASAFFRRERAAIYAISTDGSSAPLPPDAATKELTSRACGGGK